MLTAVPERFAIAQVAPHPLEDAHEVGTFAAEVSRELAERGHRVLLLAPSRSTERIRESRKAIRAARERPEALFDPGGGVRVLGVGELLFTGAKRGLNPSPPVDIARTIEEALTVAPLDFVHVHEPWAPSAGSVALRHSRALNVGSFHAPAERVLSTQVARRFVELFFGRLDARTASYRATEDLLQRYFPASYRLLPPGVHAAPPRERAGGPLRIVFCDREERGALRLFLRALRRLPEALAWEAVVYSRTGAMPTLRSSLRPRVHVVADEDAAFAGAGVVVTASAGQITAPGVLLRALAAGAVPVAARVPVYEEVLRDGDLGLLFEPGDVDVLAAQLERALRDEGLRAQLAGREQPDLS